LFALAHDFILSKVSKSGRKTGEKKFETFLPNPLEQACQTQITLRAAHWVVKLEKLIVGCSLELHMTFCVNFRHILANVIAKRTKN
jgi:hypothetical protein